MADAGRDYELFVIGSGPAGQRAAIQAAKLGKRVGLAEQKAVIGGVCINVGTIPSKTFREAVLQVAGYRQRELNRTAVHMSHRRSAETPRSLIVRRNSPSASQRLIPPAGTSSRLR